MSLYFARFNKDDQAFDRALIYRYLGLSSGSQSGIEAMKNRHRWWEYDLDAVAGRHISNDVLAAIGRVQLQKLPQIIARRRQVWETYQTALANVGGLQRPPEPALDTTSSYYLYWIQLEEKRDELAAFLSENGVYTTFRYYPLHRVKFFGAQNSLAAAERVNERTLNLPLHQNLSDDDVDKVIQLIKKFFRRQSSASQCQGSVHPWITPSDHC